MVSYSASGMISAPLRAARSSNPREIRAREPHAHRLAVDDVRKADPLWTRRLVAQVEASVGRGLERHHPVQPQLALAQDDAGAADPGILVAIVARVTLPFRGDFQIARGGIGGGRVP